MDQYYIIISWKHYVEQFIWSMVVFIGYELARSSADKACIFFENVKLCPSFWAYIGKFGTKSSKLSLMLLTFLNVSRTQVILPKHSRQKDCCAIAWIMGSIRLISMGNKYQRNWSTMKLISSSASFILWPSSHAMNTKPNARIPLKMVSHKGITFPWSNWNWREI